MIHALDEDVRSLLRSGIAVCSLTQCVDELVVNGLDAGATCITVRVDIPTLRVQVHDNGHGIAKDDLSLVGERHATSKCHSLADLNEIKSYGFRGEALASIREISGILEVVTRHKSSHKTYCKIFRRGKPLKVTESCLPRSNIGTTVTAFEVFSSLPVRRQLVSDVFDFEQIRQRLASIALINPGVSFTLYNDATGLKCLQTHKCQSVKSVFSQMFGNTKARSLQDISFADRGFRISGYIGLENHRSKSLQFVYVNGRLLLKTKIHKLVNRLCRKSLLLKKSIPLNDVEDFKLGKLKSPAKQGSERYGMFVINIICPLMEYDITLEPAKTLVEFGDWDGVLFCVQSCVESFLVGESLISLESTKDLADGETSGSQNDDSSDIDLSIYEFQVTAVDSTCYSQCIDPVNVKKSLHSSVVRRSSPHAKPGVNSDSVSPRKEDNELTGRVEKSVVSNTNRGVVRASSFEPNNLSEPFVQVIKSCEKTDSLNRMETLNSAKVARQSIIIPRTTKPSSHATVRTTKDFSSTNCFTSPNPITLQSRKTRKRYRDCSAQRLRDSSAIPDKIVRSCRHNEASNTHSTTTAQPHNSNGKSYDNYSNCTSNVNDIPLELLQKQHRFTAISEGNRKIEPATKTCLEPVGLTSRSDGSHDFIGTPNNEKETEQKLFQDMTEREHRRNISNDVISSESVRCIAEENVRSVDTVFDATVGSNTAIEDNTITANIDDPNEFHVASSEVKQGSKEHSLVDWQCTYDPHLQRTLYIHLRTGNTSFDCPQGVSSDAESMESKETGAPLACAPHVSFNCSPWLPRENRPRKTNQHKGIFDVTTRHPQSDEGVVSKMFSDWDNPVFPSVPEMEVTRLSKPTVDRIAVRTHSAVHPYRFTKDMFQTMQVIRQVDDKFIVCHVQSSSRDDGGQPDQENLIVLLDQHAVHERIRLERLFSDLHIPSTSQKTQPRIKRSAVSPPIELEFSSHELTLVKRFRAELERVGVRFVIGSDFESSNPRVIVHELPCVFVEREVSETRRRRPSVAMEIVKELIEGHIELMRDTNGVAPAIPKTVLRVLASQACHGAIKFGEPLAVDECQRLISELSTCDLPFQCAHGRPSIVPLVDLQLLKEKRFQHESVSGRPQLRKLVHAMRTR